MARRVKVAEVDGKIETLQRDFRAFEAATEKDLKDLIIGVGKIGADIGELKKLAGATLTLATANATVMQDAIERLGDLDALVVHIKDTVDELVDSPPVSTNPKKRTTRRKR